MKLHLFVILTILIHNEGVLQIQFKRMYLDGIEWSVFISKTVTCPTSSVIECGSACSAELGNNCHLFVLHKSTNLCHIGHFPNADTNYLTDEDGPQKVYVNVGKFKCPT